MSKFIRIILCVILAFCMLCGCKNQVSIEDTTTQNTATQGSEHSATKPANTANNPEQSKLLSVLYNEVPFTEESGRLVYMKDYSLSETSPVYVVPDKYSFVDFDRDGTDELVAHLQPDFSGYLLFRLVGETVFGYELGEKSMIDLKADGTFTQSGGAGMNVHVSLYFQKFAYALTEIAYQNESAEYGEYRISGSAATQEGYQAFFKAYSNKPSAQWTVVDTAYWQKSVDSISEKYSVVHKTGENFTIYTDQKEIMHFYYYVRNKSGEVIDRGYHNSRGSFDLEYQNGLLVLDYGYSAHFFDKRYYDIEGGRISQYFSRPVAESDRLVAYFTQEDDQFKLIVRDIFDTTVFYQEIIRDFSDFIVKQNYTGEFIENNTKLRVTYPVNNFAEPITEEIPLNPQRNTPGS